MSDLAPTARLRWVERMVEEVFTERVLQQWWAPDVPGYMVRSDAGEWRDVPVEAE